MTKIPFTVSARTARLIGQENFSHSGGAIIELVKNCYDADAKVSLVVFDILFEEAPEKLSFEEFEKYKSEDEIVAIAYQKHNDSYILLEDLTEKLSTELSTFFTNKNALYIIDNGEGMNEETILKKWMKIGTDNKLIDFKSDEGRIKTGAKGLGRFALDRLGEISNMKTRPKDKSIGYNWNMDWKQFEEQEKILADINADLEKIEDFDLKKELLNIFKKNEIRKVINNKDFDFSRGTIIKISNLRDDWGIISLKKLYKSLEALIPPEELGIFKIYLFLNQDTNEFGEVNGHYFNNYEYKVQSEFIADELKIKLKIYRNELNIERLKKDFKDVFNLVKSPPPYDLESLEKEFIIIEKDITKILKWRKEDSATILKSVGDFKFNFYFTKLQKPGKKDFLSYPYSLTDYGSVLKSFEKFGGIKIYRDYFRVRPYGEPGDDWLDLGKRQASSPASAGQRVGDWKVRSKQVAGVIDISRIENPQIRDKSDRGSLIENSAFETLKKIVVGIISEFEYDRSRILHPFYLKRKKEKVEKEKADLRKKAEALAQEIIDEQNKNKDEPNSDLNEVDDTTAIIEKKLAEFSHEKEEEKNQEESEKDVELRLMRSLASLGLIVASFDHELKSISNNLEPRLRYLNKHLKSLLPLDKVKGLPNNKNPFKLIEHIKVDHEKLKGWIDYSLSSIKTDKRKRKNVNFGNYFVQFERNWKFVLKERNVEIKLDGNNSKGNVLRAFEIDLDSIFNNLLTNSLEAFKLRREKYKREVNIIWTNDSSGIEINYSDNGVGLSDVFTTPDEIFDPFVTTKIDKRGNVIGTGLGMYLVKNVIDDYDGEVSIMNPEQGFEIVLKFKKRANG